MDRIAMRDIARRERQRAERIARGGRGSSTVADSELRNYSELARSRPEALATFSQIPRGAYGGFNGVGFNTVPFNSTPAGGDPPMHAIQYAPLGMGIGILGESFGLKE